MHVITRNLDSPEREIERANAQIAFIRQDESRGAFGSPVSIPRRANAYSINDDFGPISRENSLEATLEDGFNYGSPSFNPAFNSFNKFRPEEEPLSYNSRPQRRLPQIGQRYCLLFYSIILCFFGKQKANKRTHFTFYH